ncbi:related to NADPH2 dehydrogenase chain OYE2 [Ramularia collo-cygni]|uniref:Related to NADPH2 dehydrogenase chain OYE2 n=1 Tax=Ramularia collo-cygni TaxID=112498 RepID=A0A2D3URL4_9PEZI|nr:related to NADPH2 dehydrogenase chain OYE2 [Ramularia collo-cygni]CZT19802.1 related to NADPH2 dehydrogenase chain OYE2 [Ramularia collo-cygni]
MSLKDHRLFEPIRLGRNKLSSRIVMGPLGSTLADENNVLDDSAREYYGKRACVPGTLIIGEATFVSAQAGGTSECRAGIYTEAQINSWKRIVDSVHDAGSYIYLQLWALGRSAEPEIKARDGTGDVVSSSAVAQEGGPVPRAMTEEEIWTYVSDYATAAKVAVEVAGFDGVELHGGNNSLIDQFTQDVVNQRTDGWGGSIGKRSRFGIEVTAAVCAAIGSDRVGYRISPFSTYQSMGMKDAVPQFCDLLAGLKALNIAHIHLVESRIAGRVDVEAGESLDPFIEQWGNHSPIILAGGFSPQSAATAVDEEYKDKDVLIAFGRAFVTNPDLVRKIRDGTPLAE